MQGQSLIMRWAKTANQRFQYSARREITQSDRYTESHKQNQHFLPIPVAVPKQPDKQDI